MKPPMCIILKIIQDINLWNLEYENPVSAWGAKGFRNVECFHGRARKWQYDPI